MGFLSRDWCGVQWTPWLRFEEKDFKILPTTPGVYRVRAIDGDELFYIGQTGRELRGRLSTLRRETLRDSHQMPFNDPHTAAASLWTWQHAEGIQFECSAASFSTGRPSEEETRYREAFECYLLWQYRMEKQTSTRCNHGKFHPRYKKSGGAGTIPKIMIAEREKKRGRLLANTESDNPASGQSYPPLAFGPTPLDPRWMGLFWSPLASLKRNELSLVPAKAGVYQLFDAHSSELLYVGQSTNLLNRLGNHANSARGGPPVTFTFSALPQITLEYQLLEVENDLIGGYYHLMKQPPRVQFAKTKLTAKAPRLPEEEEQ